MCRKGVYILESLWSSGIEIPARVPLDGDRKASVVVIGAGMAGILIAYYVQKQGFDVVVLEADKIASGQTKNTTAKITSQHKLIYAKLIKRLGEEKAGMYAAANEGAIAEFERLIKEKHIYCHFEKKPAYLYSTQNSETLKREAEAAKKLGIKAEFVTKTELPFAIEGAVRFEDQASFHPLEFLKELSKDLNIYEQTKVLKVKGNVVYTNRGKVYAEHIVFATHYPIINIPGFYFIRQHQERSDVLALSFEKSLEGMYRSIDENGLSLRSVGNVLLLGGEEHRTGNCSEPYLHAAADRYYPEGKKVAYWSAQDCMPHDEIPLIGKYSVFRPNWYVATGFQKWGMTSSMIAALLLCDQICGRENPYETLFKPQRLHGWAFVNFVKDLGISVAGLTKGAFHMPFRTERTLARGEAGIVRMGGKRYACFRDEKNVLHKISAKCPHLGCELAWNAVESSWDCPCHGSRFDYDGKLLDNPAQINKSEQ